jgi:hypothetical protein
MIKLFISISLVLILLGCFQFKFFNGFTTDVLETLNLNAITGSVTILITIFLLNKIIKENEEKNQVKEYNEMVKMHHKDIITVLEKHLVYYITKKQTSQKIEDVIKKLDDYVQEDFYKRSYTIKMYDPRDPLNITTADLSYREYVENYYMKFVREDFTEYIRRYISVMPKPILKQLLKVEEEMLTKPLILPDIFIVSYDNLEFNVQQVKNDIKEIADEIIKLKKI